MEAAMSLLGIYLSIHMIGLVLWLGAALLLPIVILPAIRALENAQQGKFLQVFTSRYLPWFIGGGLAVGLTGWVQTLDMLDDINVPAIIAKHVAILPLIAVSAYIWFFLARKLSKSPADDKGLWNQMMIFSWVQAALGVVVLVLTGWLTG
jgi:uncharacterized membrane protein